MSHLTCSRAGITSYDMFLSKEYTDTLNLWLSGRYSHRWQQNLENNIILSMLGTKYITVAKNYVANTKGLNASETLPTRESIALPSDWIREEIAPPVDGTYTLGGETATSTASLYSAIYLKQGYYSITLKTKANHGALKPLDGILRGFDADFSLKAIHVIPDYIQPGFKDFSNIFHLEKEGVYYLSFNSLSTTPIEIRDIKLDRIIGFSPPKMAEGMKPGSPLYTKLKETGAYEFYLNNNAMPRAWSVTSLKTTDNFEQTKHMLQGIEINPAHEAIVNIKDMERIKKDTFILG
ncbi:hypothetical protein ACFLZI_03985, partial [Nitrospirota bacterium]